MNNNEVVPIISIILPVYNGERFISQAIQSIRQQSFTNWELIIIDDCSTDNTPDILKKYVQLDCRIKVFRNAQNCKLPQSLNNGFKLAKGKYLTWTSDDNLLKQHFLQEMSVFLDTHPETMFVYSDYDLIDENSKVIGTYIAESPKMLPVKNIIGASFMYRREVIDGIGEYDTTLFLIEDYEYWIRIYLKYNMACFNANLYQYRVHGNSLTAKKMSQVQRRRIFVRKKYYDQLLERIIDDDVLMAFYSTSRLYGLHEKRPGETRLCKEHPKYIVMVAMAYIRRLKRWIMGLLEDN